MIRVVRPDQTETLLIYIGSTIAIVILTAIYTTLGGIKAVIGRCDQASIMIGSARLLSVCFTFQFRRMARDRSTSRRISLF